MSNNSFNYEYVSRNGDGSRFHWADYLVFAIVLAMSSAVGLFYGVKGRSKTTEDFLMASRRMPLFPVSASLFVSWLSAISFIGDPVEVYSYGIIYWILCVGYCLALPLVAQIFAPVFYQIQVTSAYQYLKERYNVHIRTLGSVVNGLGTAVYLGIALYAPCIALSQMSGLETWHAIVIIGIVCTFYTSLGGMKAVLWADTIQMAVMFAGLLALLLVGTAKVGGATRVFQIARDGGRLFPPSFAEARFDPDPTRRATVWTYLVGGFFRVLTPFISVQLFIQRYCTVRNVKDMKIAIYLNALYFFIFVTLFSLLGLVLYAYFYKCDPLEAGLIQKKDQMIPLLVMEVMGFLPGVPGLYLACLVSAALSTLSSGQSSLATTCLKDIIEPTYHRISKRHMKPNVSLIVAILLSVVFGILTIVMALFIYGVKTKTVFSLTLTFQGAFGGPIAGIFCLGMLVRTASTRSAMTGCTLSIIVSLWLASGSFFDRPPPNPLDTLPLPLCNTNNTNVSFNTLSPLPNSGSFQVNRLYGLSPPLFSALGFILAFVLGVLANFIEKLIARIWYRNGAAIQTRDCPEEMVPFKK